MAVPDVLNPLRIPDFNGDGRTDLFGFNSSTGTSGINMLSGVRSLGSSSLITVPPGWEEPKFGNFNGDRKTDLVWRNPQTGENAIWLIEGTAATDTPIIESLQGNWTTVVGDFDGNGKTDLFWYNTSTGEYRVWLMDGVQKVKEASGQVASGWQATIADFNNDNRTDLFWRDPATGRNAVWTFDPQTLARRDELVESKPTTWSAEIVDYNGDGRSDVYWRDRLTGQNQIWIWTTELQPDATPIELPSVGGDFVIKTADFEGNGKTDFLVRNPQTGENRVWLSGDVEVQILPIATQLAGYQASISDFNGDRFSDILWTSTDATQSIVWFSDGIVPRPMAN